MNDCKKNESENLMSLKVIRSKYCNGDHRELITFDTRAKEARVCQKHYFCLEILGINVTGKIGCAWKTLVLNCHPIEQLALVYEKIHPVFYLHPSIAYKL
jgi:hypothetical protein